MTKKLSLTESDLSKALAALNAMNDGKQRILFLNTENHFDGILKKSNVLVTE